jgi:hypothetical protein
LAAPCPSDLERVIKIYLKFWIELGVRVDYIKLHNEELHNFYSSPDIIKVLKTKKDSREGNVRCLRKREREETHNLTQETLKTKLRGRSRCRRERNINIDFGDTGYEIVGLIDLAAGKDPGRSPSCFHTTQLQI